MKSYPQLEKCPACGKYYHRKTIYLTLKFLFYIIHNAVKTVKSAAHRLATLGISGDEFLSQTDACLITMFEIQSLINYTKDYEPLTISTSEHEKCAARSW